MSGQKIPILDLKAQNASVRADVDKAIARVIDSGVFILGPEVQAFEAEVAAYLGVKHAIGVSSGTDALLVALMALDVGAGDEVILPPFTFFATAGCVARTGAKPVFVDIDPVTYNIDPKLMESAITKRTKAIMPVHLFGQCADMDAIGAIARRHNLPVIEDACQAVGAEWHGRRAGSMSAIGCFSFYPTKNLGGFGDGGFMTATDPKVAERLKLLRGHGMQPRYYHHVVGINSRLDTIQAAVLNVKLRYLDAWTSLRQANAERYAKLFAEHGLAESIDLPTAEPAGRHVWNQYVIRIPGGRRDALRSYLAERKIGSEIYYPVPLHQQTCFRELGYETGSLPESERAAAETMALPIFPELTAKEQRVVVATIAEFCQAAKKRAA